MKTIYYTYDGERYPMFNVYERNGRGNPLELDDETAAFILRAYADLDRAHEIIYGLVRKDIERWRAEDIERWRAEYIKRRRAEYDARRCHGSI